MFKLKKIVNIYHHFFKTVRIYGSSSYNVSDTEASVSSFWKSSDEIIPSCITIDADDEQFNLLLPPPNVTGDLHLGHALTGSIEDAIIRWKRMAGSRCIFIPGCDHAGIATQAVFEKMLKKRADSNKFTRLELIEQLYRWVSTRQSVICSQINKLGLSTAEDLFYFTLDSNTQLGVKRAFITLFNSGDIYRDKKLVNWSFTMRSTISDIEVKYLPIDGPKKLTLPGYDNKVQFGYIYYVKYPTSSNCHLVVATTRPETIFGDVALAVNTCDHRYDSFANVKIFNPLTRNVLPMIKDEDVDRNFGTGIVKITPSHDALDYIIGLRHNLPFLNIFDDAGCLINVPSNFKKTKRYTARIAVIKFLKENNLLLKKEPHAMVLPLCSRSGDVIEKMVKNQWFVKTQKMANTALKAVESGEIEIIPKNLKNAWYHWLGTPRDWCISRQIWWGHQIPAYEVIDKKTNKTTWIVAESMSDANSSANSILKHANFEIKQDTDVLDTWFSSSLLPLTSQSWPHNKFIVSFPLIESGTDILFFWIARMVMMSLALTEKVPFTTILLHGLLTDSDGRKMSKSIGNVLDPVDIIEGISSESLQLKTKQLIVSDEENRRNQKFIKSKFPQGIPACGADALRLSLCYQNNFTQLISFDYERLLYCRRFTNKLWQAFNFYDSFRNSYEISNCEIPPLTSIDRGLYNSSILLTRWILSRLSVAVRSVNDSLENYNLHIAVRALLQFWYSEFCDVFLEGSKLIVYSSNNACKKAMLNTYVTLFDCGLKLLHPFMPFITDKLYLSLYSKVTNGNVTSLAYQPFPKVSHFDKFFNSEAEKEMKIIIDCAEKLRRFTGIAKCSNATYILRCLGNLHIGSCLLLIAKLGNCKIENENEYSSRIIKIVSDKDIGIFLESGSLKVGDREKITQNLSKRIEKNNKSVSSLKKMNERLEKFDEVDENLVLQNNLKINAFKNEIDLFQQVLNHFVE